MNVLRFSYLLLAIMHPACSSENPYSGQYRSGASEGSSNQGQNNSASQSGSSTEVSEEENTSVADEGAVSEENLGAVQLICQNQNATANFPVEMAALCVNQQPTNAFASALDSPYKGGDNPTVSFIKAEDVNGVSHFVVLSSIEVPTTIAEIFQRRSELNAQNFVEGNATIRQAQLSETPAQGDEILGSFSLEFELTVRVAIITVNETRFLQRDYLALDAEQKVIASYTYMDRNNPENNPDSLANMVSFWIDNGDSTKLITVAHQQADNRGQHNTVMQTVTNVGQRTMSITFDLLAN